MILRTPPAKRARADSTTEEILDSGRRLVIYEDPQVSDPSDQQSEHLLCTYQCRQMVKSEFVDALEKAENQVTEYEKEFEAINANLCTSETERRKLQEQLLYIEQELAAAKGRENMLQEQLLKEVNDKEARSRKQIQTNCELEVKLQNEMNLRRNAELSTSSATERVTFLERKVTHLDEKMGREKRRLFDELQQLKNDSEFSVSRIHAELDRMECRAVNAEKESELLKTQLDEAKQRLSKCLDQKKELEKQLSSSTPQVSSTDDGFLVKQLREELRRCESNVREARKMNLSCENADLLKEKLYEEKSRRERAESDLLKLAEFKASATKMQDDLSLWKSTLENIPDVSTPEDILLKFRTLQKELIDKMMEVGEGNSRLKRIEVALDTAELCKINAEAEASLAKERENASKSEAKQIELMLSVVTEERDQLRNVVDDLLKTRIATSEMAVDANFLDLEASISKKEHYIKELESSLHEQRDVVTRLNSELKFLMEKLNDDARQIKSLDREGDRLRSEISLLEAKLGHGEFSTSSTKVLKMVNTLAADSEAKQIIAVLQSELQKTKEKLQAMEDLKRQSADSGKLVDSYISEKMIQFKEQIATLEKREERYKAVFADRISVFRRACCELFGYKIVMDDHQRANGIPATHFTLQSIYADNDDEKLQFEYESGNTLILANDYTSQPEIARQIDVFIRNLNSVPAFTANLTVESFNRRTLS